MKLTVSSSQASSAGHGEAEVRRKLVETGDVDVMTRQAGFKIYADTSVRLMHYGNYGYSWEDAGMELQRYSTFHFHTK